MRALAAVTFLLVLVGALGGRWAGPFLARGNDTVLLSERIAWENAEDVAELTLESEAFRNTGRPAEDLFSEARRVEEDFRLGGMLFGAFCGLAIGIKLIRHARVPHDPFYHMDREACVSCGRCFSYCPRERLRHKNLEHANEN